MRFVLVLAGLLLFSPLSEAAFSNTVTIFNASPYPCTFSGTYSRSGNFSVGSTSIGSGTVGPWSTFFRFVTVGGVTSGTTTWTFKDCGGNTIATFTQATGNGTTNYTYANDIFSWPQTNVVMGVTNTTSGWAQAYWKFNGQVIQASSLAPGQSMSRTVTCPVCNGYAFQWGWTQNNNQAVPDGSGGVTIVPGAVNNDNTGQTSTTFPGFNPPTNSVTATGINANGNTNYVTPSQSWSNYANSGPINFGGTGSDLAKDDTLKAGFNAVKMSLDEMGYAFAKGIPVYGTNVIGGGSNFISAVVTNQNNVSVTNLPGDMSWTNELAAFHRDNTNLLGQLVDGMSVTNDIDVQSLDSEIVTNAADAKTRSAGPLDEHEAMSSDWGSVLPPTVPEGGSPSWNVTLGSCLGVPVQINFDPLSSGFSSVFAVSLSFWTWLLLTGYAYRCSVDGWECIKIFNMAHGVNVMKFDDVPAGKAVTVAKGAKQWINGLISAVVSIFLASRGMVAAIAIRGSVLVVWAAALAVFWSKVAGLGLDVGGLRDGIQVNPVSGAPSAALYLVSACFPLRLAVALTVAYISFRWSMMTVLLTASRSIKFLFGA